MNHCHVDTWNCLLAGANLQTMDPSAAGYVEPDRYELKATHRQLRLLLCRRCRALSHGEILPAVVEGRLRAAPTPTSDADAVAETPPAVAPAAAVPSSGALDDAVGDEARGLGIGVTTPEQLRAELEPLRDQKVLAV